MLAIRPMMDHSSYQPAAGVNDSSRTGHCGGYDAWVEGVIYYTPDGDGYVLYTRSRPSEDHTSIAGLAGS
ncbi:MAG: hypothetical protein GY724_26960 [Actinomycetia bacterium]|nr:hypothetical protein [Actinomycetes bacterium]MCP5033553.1 hypothetical protein [Actinomycetes bacterium]